MIARRKAGRKHLLVAGTLSGIFRGETAAVQRHRLQTVVVLPAGHGKADLRHNDGSSSFMVVPACQRR
jgi:hypothetical protein